MKKKCYILLKDGLRLDLSISASKIYFPLKEHKIFGEKFKIVSLEDIYISKHFTIFLKHLDSRWMKDWYDIYYIEKYKKFNQECFKDYIKKNIIYQLHLLKIFDVKRKICEIIRKWLNLKFSQEFENLKDIIETKRNFFINLFNKYIT